MRKAFTLLIVALFLAPVISIASDIRVTTLGEVNHVVKDDHNVALYPQTLIHYTNLVNFDVENDALSRAVFNYGTPFGYLSFRFEMEALGHDYLPQIPNPDQSENNLPGDNAIDQKLTLIWAKNLGEMDLGINFTLHGASHEMDTPNNSAVASGMGITIQPGITLMENIEASVIFQTISFTNEDADGKTITEPDGGTTFGIRGRYWIELSPSYALIPHFMFAARSVGWQNTEDKEGWKDSETLMTLGIANNIMVADDILAVSDVGVHLEPGTMEVKQNGETEEFTQGHSVLPYFKLGFEADIFSWLDVRFGAVAKWISSSQEDNDKNKEIWSYVEKDFYLGAAVHKGDFTIDLWMDPAFVSDGPYILTGNQNNFAMGASLLYMWK